MNVKDVVKAIFPHAMLWGILGLSFGMPDLQADYIVTKMPLIVVTVGWSILLAILLGIAATKKVRQIPLSGALRGYNVCSLFSFLIFIWELTSNKIAVLDPFVYACPERVFTVFLNDWPVLLRAIQSSMGLLVWGFFFGIAAGIIVSLIVGWFKPVFDVGYPFAKIMAPIPPPVYIPFFIVIFPLIHQTAILIIFIGSFWPVFATTCFATYAFDRRYIEAAQMLGSKSSLSLIRRVVFPGVKPQIFTGVFLSIILAFVMLIVAEMVGASSGLGFYLLTQRLLSHYAEVMAGILTVGMVVILWTLIFDKIEARSLKWQAA